MVEALWTLHEELFSQAWCNREVDGVESWGEEHSYPSVISKRWPIVLREGANKERENIIKSRLEGFASP